MVALALRRRQQRPLPPSIWRVSTPTPTQHTHTHTTSEATLFTVLQSPLGHARWFGILTIWRHPRTKRSREQFAFVPRSSQFLAEPFHNWSFSQNKVDREETQANEVQHQKQGGWVQRQRLPSRVRPLVINASLPIHVVDASLDAYAADMLYASQPGPAPAQATGKTLFPGAWCPVEWARFRRGATTFIRAVFI
jgi:hypothetical protein